MADRERPTKKQRELLTFVENFISGHGYGPSYREIRAGMGYSSVATVAKHVDNLISRGHLRKRDHSARSLEIVDATEADKLTVRGVAPSEAEERWLVRRIEEKFTVAEEAQPLSQSAVDELYVLVGALRVLGFEGASVSFGKRLSDIKKKVSD